MKIFNLIFLLIPFASLSQVPGCVAIRGDYLFMKSTEVSNKDYRGFLNSISDEDSLKNIPNSKMWGVHTFCKPIIDVYYRHPAYANYPVVNLTQKQANAYCSWLTGQLNTKFPVQKVIVRLPTEKEWEFAAKGGNKFAIYPWGHETMRVKSGKNQGRMHANFMRGKGDYMGVAGNLNDGATITAPVTSYWPNDYGLYCMSGNVAEMVSEKGLVKGGSWNNRADWLQIQKQQFVYSASPEVGFRYVVEVIELPQPTKKPKSLVLNKRYFKKYFAEINDTLSVGKYEVTNELYNTFLGDLNNSFFKVKTNKWNGLFPYSSVWATNYSDHDNFNNHPVVNVDYEFVHAFCDWMSYRYSELYNVTVEMRLPKEIEWELAASGSLENPPYPWGGPYTRNAKGCYLANHNPKMNEDENVYGYDTLSLNNFFHTYFTDLHDYDEEAVIAPVDSYFPNGNGIYNMAGNVAEMVLDSNFTKGGSWKSNSYFLQIDSKEVWNKSANPFTGFRVVMIKKKD